MSGSLPVSLKSTQHNKSSWDKLAARLSPCRPVKLSRFACLEALKVTWSTWRADVHTLELLALLAALPGSVRSVAVLCPLGWEVASPLTLPPTLTALKLEHTSSVEDGGAQAHGYEVLGVVLHARMQRLNMSFEGLHVCFHGDMQALQGLNDPNVGAPQVSLGPHLGVIVGQYGGVMEPVLDQDSDDELDPVLCKVHMGPWPPRWPCECGACEECHRATFWPDGA